MGGPGFAGFVELIPNLGGQTRPESALVNLWIMDCRLVLHFGWIPDRSLHANLIDSSVNAY